MQRSARLQIIGPLVLFFAVLAAEGAAYALSEMPSSAFLWYLNLEVFSLFRKSRAALAEVGNLPFAQVLLIAGPITAIGMIGLSLKNKLCLAISSNLSFCFAAFAGSHQRVNRAVPQHVEAQMQAHPIGLALASDPVFGPGHPRQCAPETPILGD